MFVFYVYVVVLSLLDALMDYNQKGKESYKGELCFNEQLLHQVNHAIQYHSDLFKKNII